MRNSLISVRLPHGDDWRSIRELVRLHHEQTVFAHLPFSETKYEALEREARRTAPHHCLIVAEREGRLVGMAWFSAGEHVLGEGGLLTTVHLIAVDAVCCRSYISCRDKSIMLSSVMKNDQNLLKITVYAPPIIIFIIPIAVFYSSAPQLYDHEPSLLEELLFPRLNCDLAFIKTHGMKTDLQYSYAIIACLICLVSSALCFALFFRFNKYIYNRHKIIYFPIILRKNFKWASCAFMIIGAYLVTFVLPQSREMGNCSIFLIASVSENSYNMLIKQVMISSSAQAVSYYCFVRIYVSLPVWSTISRQLEVD